MQRRNEGFSLSRTQVTEENPFPQPKRGQKPKLEQLKI